MSFALQPVAFAHLPGWREDDPADLIAALGRGYQHVSTAKPYRTGSLGVTTDDLLPVFKAAADSPALSADDARAFFEQHFTPCLIVPDDRPAGFVTSYYEPDVEVSAEQGGAYQFPFYRQPDDLVAVDDSNRPAEMPPSYVFGQQKADGTIGFYPDRRDIDQGTLTDRNLEIAWAKSKVEVFFAHVQGATRLQFADGSTKRITYAAKAGHPFSGIGRHLIDLGEIDEATVSMATIRGWLADHPERVDEILWHNRSYIFFREIPIGDPELGPIAAAKVQLTPGRSLAVDRLIHTFGVPFFIHSPSLTHMDNGKLFARAMLALDTGTAIVGPARGDIFTGSGDAAGDLAGSTRNEADFYILLPKAAAARLVP